MKRVLFSMVLLMAVSFSFAQMKNVKEAKSMANDVKPNFKQAEQLIKEAMKNPETKDLADTWDVAGFIQRRINEEQMKNAFLKKLHYQIHQRNLQSDHISYQHCTFYSYGK